MPCWALPIVKFDYLLCMYFKYFTNYNEIDLIKFKRKIMEVGPTTYVVEIFAL